MEVEGHRPTTEAGNVLCSLWVSLPASLPEGCAMLTSVPHEKAVAGLFQSRWTQRSPPLARLHWGCNESVDSCCCVLSEKTSLCFKRPVL